MTGSQWERSKLNAAARRENRGLSLASFSPRRGSTEAHTHTRLRLFPLSLVVDVDMSDAAPPGPVARRPAGALVADAVKRALEAYAPVAYEPPPLDEER